MKNTVVKTTVLLTITLHGCSSSEPRGTPASESVDAHAAEVAESPDIPSVTPVPAILPPIVARISGSTTVTREELERAVRANETKAGQVVPPQFRDLVYRRVLDQLIDFYLLQEANFLFKNFSRFNEFCLYKGIPNFHINFQEKCY